MRTGALPARRFLRTVLLAGVLGLASTCGLPAAGPPASTGGAAACSVATSGLPAVLDPDGRTVSLAERFQGRHAVLVLAGLGTPAEQAMLELIQTGVGSLRRRREAALAVVFTGNTVREAAALVSQKSHRYPWFADPGGALAAALDVDCLPMLLLLDPGGKPIYRTSAISEGLVRGVLKRPGRQPPSGWHPADRAAGTQPGQMAVPH